MPVRMLQIRGLSGAPSHIPDQHIGQQIGEGMDAGRNQRLRVP